VKLSANLGFLWTELELCDAIRAAGAVGFNAVEVHWPYITHALEVALTLEETGLRLLSLNTVAGDLAKGEFGLAALPGRQGEAQAAIDKAFAYAADASAQNVHVLAGKASGPQATETYIANVRYAAARGREYGIGVLLEPLSEHASPGYFLNDYDQAIELVDRIAESNVKILLDCFHASFIADEILPLIDALGDRLGHIQFASVPDRHEPDRGEVDYRTLLPAIVAQGYSGYFGAEYHPSTGTDRGLAWMEMFRPAYP
jgi:hydroxypyruvate isomerase